MRLPMMANVKIRVLVLLAVLAGALLLGGCRSTGKRSDTRRASAVPTKSAHVEKRRQTKKRKVGAQQKQPTSPTTPPASFCPQMPGWRVAHVNVPGAYVALTFDDGPDATYTPRVLDILRRYNARATFFVVGYRAAQHPEILARAVEEGHEVGNHSWHHLQLTHLSPERVRAEIARTGSVIRRATGKDAAVMRPPYGDSGPALVRTIAKDFGMLTVLWSVETQDWRHPGVSVVQQRAIGRAQSGSIILLHDVHASTLAAVEGIVKGLQKRGFTLVTVTELVEMGRRAAQACTKKATRKVAKPTTTEKKAKKANVKAKAHRSIWRRLMFWTRRKDR